MEVKLIGRPRLCLRGDQLKFTERDDTVTLFVAEPDVPLLSVAVSETMNVPAVP